FDAELPGGLCGGDGDVRELGGVRFRVDRAVPVDQHAVLQEHEEDRGDDGDPRSGLDELQRRADGVGRGVGGTGDHAVDVAQVDHHGGKVGAVEHAFAGGLDGDALVGAQRRVFGGEAVQQVAAGRVGDGDAVQVDAVGGRQFADLVGVAEDDQVADAAAADDLGGPQDAQVLALGQHDALAGGPGPFDELVQETQRGHGFRGGQRE